MIDRDQDEARQDAEDIDIVFRVNPLALRIRAITLNIANCPKCEVFSGDCFEYLCVQNGAKAEDMPELDVYKFEISFAESLSPVVSLKVP